jgi:pSer/pThr/pTyr-binding forkhead associated (FHA) protein
MTLELYLTNGPLKGQRHPIRTGFRIGRSQGDLILDDPKASSIHARIVKNEDGQWLILDEGSTNGVKVNGMTVNSATLSKGDVITIGSTSMEVQEIPKKMPSEPIRPASKEKTKADTASVSWDEGLEKFTRSYLVPQLRDQPQSVKPFPVGLKLVFFRGLQVDTEWVLGYGPRKIGKNSLDLPILEPEAPDVCFELIPETHGIEFHTEHTSFVQLNRGSVTRQLLKSGDVISMGGTFIEVFLVDENGS